MRARRAIAMMLVVGALGCQHKKKTGDDVAATELSGLAAIPASARVVIGVSPARLADSDVVARAFARLLERDADLAMRVDRLAKGCGFDWRTRVQSLHVALTDAAPEPMLVATGQLEEADLAKCVQNTVGEGGGSLTVEQVEGRPLYHVIDGDHSMWFSFGTTDTVVLSGSRDLVVAGLGDGKKVMDAPELRALLQRADTRAPLWAVGRVDDKLGQRLLRITRGKVATAPRAFLASLDPSDGLHADLAAVTASAEDAKTLESQVGTMLALVAMAAQSQDLGPLASRITTRHEGDTLHISVALTDDELKEVLSKVDSGSPPAQDAGPSASPDGSPAHGQ
jgi:hypothetical protein